RLVPVSPSTEHGLDRQTGSAPKPFRIELMRPGILDSLKACSIARMSPRPTEIEIEIAAAGLNFKDLMLAMGMWPKEALTEDAPQRMFGRDGSGRIVAIGSAVSEFAIGDEVVALAPGSFASHILLDQRFAMRKPQALSFEQAATIPMAFSTAW